MAIEIKLQGGETLDRAAKVWSQSSARLHLDLLRASVLFGQDAVGISRNEYLTGPRPERLAVRTGSLRRSIASKVTESGPDVEVNIGSNLEYARAWELGRKPGSFPPVEALARWARLALGVKAEEARSVGFLIARRIFQRGQEPRPFLAPAIHDALPGLEKGIATALKNVGQAL